MVSANFPAHGFEIQFLVPQLDSQHVFQHEESAKSAWRVPRIDRFVIAVLFDKKALGRIGIARMGLDSEARTQATSFFVKMDGGVRKNHYPITWR